MQPLVSVIVPIYNVEKYLKRCVESILKQEYKNIEIILVDDGSPDNCGNICDEYEKSDGRIKVIHKQNGGLSDARNTGIKFSNGDYYTFVDSDDYIAPYMIKDMVALAESQNIKLVQCEFARGMMENYVFSSKNDFVIIDAKRAFETRETKICVCGKLFHKNLIDETDFEVGKINEDEFFTYKKIYESKKIILLREKGYYYYQQSESIMHKKQKKLRLDIIEAYDERIKYFENKSEKRLVEISIKEKCIREILLYARAKGCEDETSKRLLLLDLYRREYPLIRHKKFNVKESLLLEVYYLFPKVVNVFVESRSI